MQRAIRAFDAFLAKALGVVKFTQEPDCILRLQHSTLRHALELGGRGLPRGTPVLMLHLWNERILPLPDAGADFAWARWTSRSLILSLRLVARHLAGSPFSPMPQAIGGVTVLGLASGTADILTRLGFQARPNRDPLGRFGEWWENAYTWMLMWAYNPASLRGRRLGQLRRTEYWMMTTEFLNRFHST